MSALKGAGSTRAWRRLRAYVLGRDGYRCQVPGEVLALPGSWAAIHRPGTTVCGAFADHADHVLPRIAGGTDDETNVRAACARHNLERGARLEDTPTTDSARRPGRWEW